MQIEEKNNDTIRDRSKKEIAYESAFIHLHT